LGKHIFFLSARKFFLSFATVKNFPFFFKKMSALLSAAVNLVEGFGYDNDQAMFGYHYEAHLQRDEHGVKCILSTGSIFYPPHEFNTSADELVEFLNDTGNRFENKLASDTMLGETKMCENWPVNVKNLRAGLMKAARDVLILAVEKLSVDITKLENQEIDLRPILQRFQVL
jgi:hypothetical protein